MTTVDNIGDEIANLGECVVAFGDWRHVLTFNILLVAIAALGGRAASWPHMRRRYAVFSPNPVRLTYSIEEARKLAAPHGDAADIFDTHDWSRVA